ncbi:MAG: mannitol dehydrogenase family protein, partial [Chloroflexi bacterium]|nr:mannitol dehydrogenase family protein [Chloroflexota bacterium]
LTLAVAGWFRYLRGVDEQGQEIAIADRLAGELRARANSGGDDPRPLLELRGVFGHLGKDEAFVAALSADVRELDARGARATLTAALASPRA